jgi:TM2 domain-containing membrane protein YozV
MKIFKSITAFMLCWTIIAFITALIISFVFMVDYVEVVHNPLYIVLMIFANSTISGIVADQVYTDIAC